MAKKGPDARTLRIYSRVMGFDTKTLSNPGALKKLVDGGNWANYKRTGGSSQADAERVENARTALKELHGIDYETPGWTPPK